MTNQCPRCGTPRLGDSPICQGCGLDFLTVGAPRSAPAPQAAAYPQPQPQAFQQPAPQPQPQSQPFQQPAPQAAAYPQPQPTGVPGFCPRCQAPLYPGYPICGNCGLDLRAAWGYGGPTGGPTRSMLPIALVGGLVLALIVAAAAVFAISQARGDSSASPSVVAPVPVGASPQETAAPSTPDARTTAEPTLASTPSPTAGPTIDSSGAVTEGNWVGVDTTGAIFTVSFTVRGSSLVSLTVGYLTSSDDVYMWIDNSTIDISGGSFDTSAFTLETGQAGATIRLTGAFTSATAISGTYEMHISGATVSGKWSGVVET